MRSSRRIVALVCATGMTAALGLSASSVRAALASQNVLSAVGQTKGGLVQLNPSATTARRSRSTAITVPAASTSVASARVKTPVPAPRSAQVPPGAWTPRTRGTYAARTHNSRPSLPLREDTR